MARFRLVNKRLLLLYFLFLNVLCFGSLGLTPQRKHEEESGQVPLMLCCLLLRRVERRENLKYGQLRSPCNTNTAWGCPGVMICLKEELLRLWGKLR